MSIVGELLQRWRLKTESRPSAPAPVVQDAEPSGDAASTPASDEAPEADGATHEIICRLCGRPLRDDDVVAVHAADVVHSDCYDESLSREPR